MGKWVERNRGRCFGEIAIHIADPTLSASTVASPPKSPTGHFTVSTSLLATYNRRAINKNGFPVANAPPLPHDVRLLALDAYIIQSPFLHRPPQASIDNRATVQSSPGHITISRLIATGNRCPFSSSEIRQHNPPRPLHLPRSIKQTLAPSSSSHQLSHPSIRATPLGNRCYCCSLGQRSADTPAATLNAVGQQGGRSLRWLNRPPSWV